ncbi:MAG: 6-phosphofructokinase [Deltaproteobacteria bacterium]|nr:6-phosphofructokinase [Deltaproteobacteria bacterium]
MDTVIPSEGKRVAVMTGGGDCPGLNAVIRGAVKTGVRKHGFSMLGIEDAFSGLIDPNYRSPHGNIQLTGPVVRDILARGGTILGTSNRSDPFRYVIEEDGVKREVDISARVMENFDRLGLDALISIGGDGSMRIAKRFMDLGMPVVGVPKTIDNDLAATDQTFGFDTAVQTATDALDRIRDTAESHDRVMLVEVMGRDAGFIALHAGLAGGAHAILLPEIPYNIEPLVKRIEDRRLRGQPFSVIVVAEGAKPMGGAESVIAEKLGEMPRLAGAAQRVTLALEDHIESDMRVTVLGHVQRGGSPSCFDRILGTRFGRHAAELVAAGDFGKMVALRGGEIVGVPIEEAVNKCRRVELDCQALQTARAMGVVFGDEV